MTQSNLQERLAEQKPFLSETEITKIAIDVLKRDFFYPNDLAQIISLSRAVIKAHELKKSKYYG